MGVCEIKPYFIQRIPWLKSHFSWNLNDATSGGLFVQLDYGIKHAELLATTDRREAI
jgi:hypothetical protein